MAEKLFITNSGLAEITKAQKAKSKIKITDIGLGTGTTASHTASALQSEIKKVKTFKGGITTASEMELYITDKTADAYKVSEVGLFDGAGNLLAIYSTDAPEGLESKTAESFLILVLLIKFKDSITAVFDFKTKAPTKTEATTTKAGVFELATDAELEAHTAKDKAITCKQIPTAEQLQGYQNHFNKLNKIVTDNFLKFIPYKNILLYKKWNGTPLNIVADSYTMVKTYGTSGLYLAFEAKHIPTDFYNIKEFSGGPYVILLINDYAAHLNIVLFIIIDIRTNRIFYNVVGFDDINKFTQHAGKYIEITNNNVKNVLKEAVYNSVAIDMNIEGKKPILKDVVTQHDIIDSNERRRLYGGFFYSKKYNSICAIAAYDSIEREQVYYGRGNILSYNLVKLNNATKAIN